MSNQDDYDDIPEGFVVTESLDAGTLVLAPDGTQTPLALFREQQTMAEETGRHQVSLATATSWMDSDPDSLDESLARRRKNRQALMDWLWGTLVSSVDYGQIKPSQKPSLWQPGAEKLCGYLDLTPSFPDAERYVNMVAEGLQIGDIVVRCFLTDANGRLVGEGMGAREREQTPKLNDRIKMAQKSALIDAVKRCAGLSEVFTQDEADEGAGAPIDQEARNYLQDKAQALFGDQADQVLMSLARRRFNITDGNWHDIPAMRLQDAIRSLEQKASDGFEAEGGAT
jgi:hypothetical protein